MTLSFPMNKWPCTTFVLTCKLGLNIATTPEPGRLVSSVLISEACGETWLSTTLTVLFVLFFSFLAWCFSEGLPTGPEGRRTRVWHLSGPAEPVLPTLCLYCQSPSANQHGQPLSRGSGSNLGPILGPQRFI